MPLDLEATAINVLETTAYFQGKQTVNDYLDQFWDLIYDSRYTDPKTVVVKSAEALMALAGMAFEALRHGPRRLVRSCSPDGSEPHGR